MVFPDGPSDEIDAGTFVERTPKEAQYARKIRGGLDAYATSSITHREVAKLLRSPEFQVHYMNNGARLRLADRADRARSHALALAAFFLSLVAAWNLPFAALDAEDTALRNRSLIEILQPRQRIETVVGELPLVAFINSLAAPTTLAPLVCFVAYLVGLANVGPGASLLAALGLCLTVASLHAFSFGLGFGVLFGVLLLKPFVAW